MHYFVGYGYSGRKFTGFQRGNGKRSVEDGIISALTKMNLDPEISSAARTDRGVSATGNVFSMNCSGNIRKVMADLNRNTSDMVFHSYAEVEEGRSPRHNESKTYRYIVFDYGREELQTVLSKFQGKHDFSNFARVDHRNPVRTIDTIEVIENGDHVSVDFHARSFIWQQIRRIMGFVFHAIENNLDIDPFSEHRIVKLAPPDQLILKRITYSGIEFKPFVPVSLARHVASEARKSRLDFLYHENILSTLHEYL